MLRKAEGIAYFGGAHRPVPPGPTVDVLEEMVMNASVMPSVERALGQPLVSSERSHFEFESLKKLGIAKAELVLESGRSLVRIRIIEGVVAFKRHQRDFAWCRRE